VGNIMNRLVDELAAGSSRRGFISTLGKVALGAAALAAGQGLDHAIADSETIPLNVSLACCSGTGCPNIGCPSGTYESIPSEYCCCNTGYDSCAQNHNCWWYVCHVCNRISDNSYYCTYPTHLCNPPTNCLCWTSYSGTCPQIPGKSAV